MRKICIENKFFIFKSVLNTKFYFKVRKDKTGVLKFETHQKNVLQVTICIYLDIEFSVTLFLE